MVIKFLDGKEKEFNDLVGANLAGANLRGADLTEANLAWANLAWANLRGVDLAKANLAGANLRGADLAGANLRGVDLEKANLSGANLAWANLSGANLSRANLAWVNLSYTINTQGLYSFSGLGRECRVTVYCKSLNTVWCGCFSGSLDDFEAKIKVTHRYNPEYLSQYLSAVLFLRSL